MSHETPRAACVHCDYVGPEKSDGRCPLCNALLVPASPPAAETGRLVEELGVLVERWRELAKTAETTAEEGGYLECADQLESTLSKVPRVSGQPVGFKAAIDVLPPVILFGVAYVSRDDVLKALEAKA